MYVTHRTLNKKEQPQRQCCRSNAWLCYVRGSRISLFPHWWVPKAESDTYLLRGGLSRHLSWCNLMMMNKERGQQTQVWEAGGWEPHVSSWPMNHQEGGKLEIYKSVKQALGEGNGTPLQYSCLENPMDGGAWWAAVYGVAQSQTRLKRLSSSSSKTGSKLETASLYGQHGATQPGTCKNVYLEAQILSPRFSETPWWVELQAETRHHQTSSGIYVPHWTECRESFKRAPE